MGERHKGFVVRTRTTADRGLRYQVQIRLTGFAPESYTFDTEKSAQSFGADRVSDLRSKGSTGQVTKQSQRMTLAELLAWYQSSAAWKAKKQSTQERDTRTVSYWLSTPLACRALGRLSDEDLAVWCEARAATHSANSVRIELALVSACWNAARKARPHGLSLRLANPVETVAKPSVANTARFRVITSAEKRAVYKAALTMSRRQRDYHFGTHKFTTPSGMRRINYKGELAVIVRLCLESPLRRGEVVALKWENFCDVSHRDPVIGEVTMGVILLGSDETKTSTARAVPLSPRMRLRLLSLRPSIDATGPIFQTPVAQITQAVRRAAAAAGVENLVHHDFKRYSTTQMARLDVPRDLIRRASGTRTDRVLDRHYMQFEGAEVGARMERARRLASALRSS